MDTRAFVIGDEVIASIKRKAVKGEERSNLHAGGEGKPCRLDSYTKKIAVSTAKTIGAEICAVDMLESAKGPLVIEANVSPGLQGITKSTGINAADKIAKFLYEKTKIFLESGKKTTTSKMFEEIGIAAAKSHGQQIITSLDFRGDRILLPKIVSGITKFSEKDEVVIKVDKGEVVIKKSGV